MAADRPDGPAPTMMRSRTDIRSIVNCGLPIADWSLTMVRRIPLAVFATLVVLSTVPRAQGRRFISEQDLLKFTWVADPQISPDGLTVAFVRVTVNERENQYETSVFTVPSSGTEAPRRLTSGIRDTSPRWAPDGKRMVFVRAIEKDAKAQPAQLY